MGMRIVTMAAMNKAVRAKIVRLMNSDAAIVCASDRHGFVVGHRVPRNLLL